ncbi:hypothetical protein N7495_005812 [Penicillium taxi]|uniref:uncharacterized protein n=1 Tax=Penicillium taxi TaxID=168475 RepID=UPI002544E325|nr:uncharacterized protein N7495_005812 [Penicillium taxi]KAJ5894121.1 hypothetical protein N7495_005812 [Penicillium taxi]
MTDISTQTIKSIWNKAIERGFDPLQRPLLVIDAYVADANRSGRPKKQTPEVIASALAKVRLDRYGREKTCTDTLIES